MEILSELQAAENIEQEDDDSMENADYAELEHTPEAYQIRPKLEEKFKPLSAKEVIHNVLFDQLSTKEYNQEEAQKWTKEIADLIREKMKKLEFKKYKYIVNVILGSRNGSGVKVGTRCVWDTEADSYAHDSFTNDTMFCVAAVYAVYVY